MRRSRAVALQLFRTKSPDHLIAEAEAPDRQMKRTLGPLALTCIGIGAVIGAGIFSLTGTAAAGQTFASGLETPVINFIQAWFSGTGAVLGRAGAGPAIAASFIVAGIACAFAALCYAELASMIPVSGSAYTYSYATMGEIDSVDHRLGPDFGICRWQHGRSRELVGIFRPTLRQPVSLEVSALAGERSSNRHRLARQRGRGVGTVFVDQFAGDRRPLYRI